MPYPDYNDPRQRIAYMDEPLDWDSKNEPIPLSMRPGLAKYILDLDDERFGPPGARKSWVVEYETKKRMERVPGTGYFERAGLRNYDPANRSQTPEAQARRDEAAPKRKSVVDDLPPRPYYTVHPKPGSCDKCQGMAKTKFYDEPIRPHPNCKCEIRRHVGNEWEVVAGRPWEKGEIAMGSVQDSPQEKKRRNMNEAISRAMKGSDKDADGINDAREIQDEILTKDAPKALKDGAEIVKEVNEKRLPTPRMPK